MFKKSVYVKRREQLKKLVRSGVILILGNDESPMNYQANPYHFRQDSSFLYFFGIDKPGFTGLIDIDENKDYLVGEDFTIDDIIWMGPQPSVKDLAKDAGINNSCDQKKMKEILDNAVSQGRRVHFLPQYRAENLIKIEELLGISTRAIKKHTSVELINAIVKLRSIKSKEEIQEIETALETTFDMYSEVMKMAKPGIYESEIVGRIEGIAGSAGNLIAFPIILTIHGETLHNHFHGNKLQINNLLIVDSGAESPEHYASDITRTFPVGGKFTAKQKDIYEIVLESLLYTVKAIKPGKKYKNIHLKVARIIANGLKDIGLMKGNVDDAVKAGAHALFFPHGLGHMMGLDVHDMENLGEDHVGYNKQMKRSEQFGLAYLRLAKELQPNYVLTVEPGIYFIPALIEKWKSEKKHAEFINYSKAEKYKDFGGIRIEDDVLVTENGSRVLGKPIPKTIDEIESIMVS